MSFEKTITEPGLDATSRQFIQDLHNDNEVLEPDLAVDGLSESILSRFIRLITFGRS